MPNQTPTVRLLAKAPIRGVCKTRLAKHIGDSRAAELQSCLLKDVVDLVRNEAIPFSIHMYVPSEHSLPAGYFPPELMPYVRFTQTGDLGSSLQECLSPQLDRGSIFIGTDSPLAIAEHLRTALHLMNGGESVLGPCHDGGVYLIGVPASWKNPFKNIPWGTPGVFQTLRTNAKASGIKSFDLPISFDLDARADIVENFQAFQQEKYKGMRTSALLRTWKQQRLV